MPGNTWSENFQRRVRVSCKNDYCDRTVEVIIGVARGQGAYCDVCRREARRIWRKNYEDRNRTKRLARKR